MEKQDNLFFQFHLLKERINFLEDWVTFLESKRDIGLFFKVNEFQNVGIYAYGKYGRFLKKKLQEAGINVICAIDQGTKEDGDGFSVFSLANAPEESIMHLDILVVSTVGIDVWDVKNTLQKKGLKCPVIHVSWLFRCFHELRL